MAVSFPRKNRAKRPISKLHSSMASTSSIHSKPVPSSMHRCYVGRSGSLLFALVTLTLVFVFYVTGKHTSSRGSILRFYTFDIVHEFPHDPQAFTQGLLYGGNDTLLESTGLYGRSSVRIVHLQSGKVERSYKMDRSIFGEGLTLFGDRLLQVTWLTKIGFIYDRYNLNKIGTISHPMKDGWGLATDGRVIFGSDGSSTLYQLDPFNLKAIKMSTVKDNMREIPLLNELEYVNGEIWANVWQTDCIARISQDNGSVLSWILLHELRKNLLKSGHMDQGHFTWPLTIYTISQEQVLLHEHEEWQRPPCKDIDVLNGIAWDEDNKRLFVTGKLWPKLYEIRLRPITTPLNDNIEELCPIRAWN